MGRIQTDLLFIFTIVSQNGQNYTSYTAKLQEVKVSLTVYVDALLHQLPLLDEMCTDLEKQNQSSLI